MLSFSPLKETLVAAFSETHTVKSLKSRKCVAGKGISIPKLLDTVP